MNTTLNIFDQDGFIAIVNTDKYSSFVDNDWELDQLMAHFINQMNQDSFVIWATNYQGGDWQVKITDKPSNDKVYRQFSKTIQVTTGELYLTNYTDLTMAAQFADEKVPSKHNSNLFVKIPNGKYELQIRQMFDPKISTMNWTRIFTKLLFYQRTIKVKQQTMCFGGQNRQPLTVSKNFGQW
jgi:hypothetical protein